MRAGEKIAQGASAGADIFSPMGGTVSAIAGGDVASAEGFVSAPAVELVDLEGDWTDDDSGTPRLFDWLACEPNAILARLTEGSLPTHRRPVEPLAVWVARARNRRCVSLVANAMENQPCVCADHRMLVHRGRQVVEGLAILAKLLAVSDIVLAADQRRLGDYAGLISVMQRFGVTPVALPPKYPIGADPLLLKVLTGRKTPAGGSGLDLGVAVVGPATCLAVYRWVVLGKRAVGRVVTLGGEQCPKPGNFWVPLGTPCRELIPGCDELVDGGPMVGLPCAPGAVVTAATDSLVAMASARPPIPSPCIRCSWCTDHCPARLNVAALNDAFELGLMDRAMHLGAAACIECGVCSYICPSCLPLSQRVRRLKRTIVRGRASAAADGHAQEVLP